MVQVDVDDKPKMKIPCLVYSRIVGYLTPVQNWHDAKQREFSERKMFDVNKVLKQEDKGEQCN